MKNINLSFVNETEKESRLDIFLLNCVSSEPEYDYITRSQIKIFINSEFVKINDKIVSKPARMVSVGDKVDISFTREDSSYLEPYDYPLNIVFEDEHLLVINKDKDIIMHPGAGNRDKTLLNAVVTYLNKDIAYVVHRLDKDTTGLVIVAKTEKAKIILSKQFYDREVIRKYKALCLVSPRSNKEIQNSDEGRIETLIGRHPVNRKVMTVLESDARTAITNWKVLEKHNYAYLVELKLDTGRTHQIRVHMNHLKSPVIGDRTYGNFASLPKDLRVEADKFGRQALHAYYLEFKHPITEEEMTFEADLPKDFSGLALVFKS